MMIFCFVVLKDEMFNDKFMVILMFNEIIEIVKSGNFYCKKIVIFIFDVICVIVDEVQFWDEMLVIFVEWWQYFVMQFFE